MLARYAAEARALGAERVAAIGQGANDAEMLKAAAMAQHSAALRVALLCQDYGHLVRELRQQGAGGGTGRTGADDDRV